MTKIRLPLEDVGVNPSIHDRLEALGAYTLGDNPSQEAKDAVLRRWISLLDGADPLQVRAERDALAGLRGLSAGLVDAALASRPRVEERGDHQGTAVALSDPEPWLEPVDGDELLAALARTFRRFLALPDGAADALALWTLHAHAHDVAEVSPLLAFTSPTKRCGKSTALVLLSALVPRALPASNLTPAGVFRTVERYRPTLLVDEADTFLARGDELRGVLNASHYRPLAFVPRTVGEEHEPRLFSTWCPKAIALIGQLPETLADRSIELRMKRSTSKERLVRVRLHRLHELEPLRRQAWRWAQDNLETLRAADPEIPDGLHDRAADNWRPLLAIADLASGPWPQSARDAAKALSRLADDEQGVAVLLLADLWELFGERGAERLATADILKALHDRDDRPWPEWGRQKKPLSAVALAKLLRPFGVTPRKVRDGSETFRGYLREDLADAFRRYVATSHPQGPPDPPSKPEHPEHPSNDAAFPEFSTRNNPDLCSGSESGENPHPASIVPGVPGQHGGLGEDEQYLLDERDGMGLS